MTLMIGYLIWIGGRLTLNVEVKSPDELEVWMAAVKHILTSSGRTFVGYYCHHDMI
jgi:hypothetical protein